MDNIILMENILKDLKGILKENNLQNDLEFFKSKTNRASLYKSNPGAFLAKDKKGVPIFPILSPANAISIPVLKKSLMNAKRLHTMTGEDKYIKFIEKIKFYMNSVENPVTILKVPRTHNVSDEVMNILKKQVNIKLK